MNSEKAKKKNAIIYDFINKSAEISKEMAKGKSNVEKGMEYYGILNGFFEEAYQLGIRHGEKNVEHLQKLN